MNRNHKYHDIFQQCLQPVEEVFVDLRKWKPQTRYVGEIKEFDEYWGSDNKWHIVPDSLVGLWMLKWQGDLSLTPFNDSVRNDDWVKCEKKEIITYEYIEVE